MSDLTVTAVDLGGSNARVASVTFTPRATTVQICSRLHHRPAGPRGRQCWDWTTIRTATEAGLSQALRDNPASLSIDAWGLDYGLLRSDRSVRMPYAYRADRGRTAYDNFTEADLATLTTRTRTALSSITTIFQLLSEDENLDDVDTILPIPSLLQYELIGVSAADPSIASTTGLTDPATGHWDVDLIESLGLPTRIFPPIREAGDVLGNYRGVSVVVSYGHDAAAAINASRSTANDIVAILGTWLIVGTSSTSLPDVSRPRLGIENGNDGLVHVLSTQHGLWVLDQLGANGLDTASRLNTRPTRHLDLGDSSLLTPIDMESTLRALLALPPGTSIGEVRNHVLHSYATTIDRAASDVALVEELTHPEIVLVGGGAANRAIGQLVSNRISAANRFGPHEPAVLGNAMRQAIALGYFENLEDGATHLRDFPVRILN